MLARLFSRIAVSKPKAAAPAAAVTPHEMPVQGPAAAAPPSAVPAGSPVNAVPEGRIAVLSWIRWDRLPPFDAAELDAHPARAQAAGLLARSIEEATAEKLVRDLLREQGAQAVDQLLLAEILLRRGDSPAVLELLRGARAFAPALRARAAVINGQLLFERGDFPAARLWADIALADAPSAWAVNVLHGLLLEAEGQGEAAILQARRLLAARPDEAGLRNSLARMLIRDSRDVEGLMELLAIDHMALLSQSVAQAGMWDGRIAPGDALLITGGAAGAGLGDVIQHLRFLPGLRARTPGARLVLRTHRELLPLVRAMGVVDEVSVDASAEEDRFCAQTTFAQLALFHALEAAPPALPAPYLKCAPAQVAAMRETLRLRLGTAAPALRVGLRWQGRPGGIDGLRSIPPRHLAPLFDLPGVAWIAVLEQGNPDLAHLRAGGLPLLDMSDALRDLTDTAALLCNLDLLITVDTSVAHLAGALGVPTWTLSRPDADGRWRTGERTDLYASMRLFRHPGRLDWDEVVGQVKHRLAECVRAGGDARAFATALMETSLG